MLRVGILLQQMLKMCSKLLHNIKYIELKYIIELHVPQNGHLFGQVEKIAQNIYGLYRVHSINTTLSNYRKGHTLLNVWTFI